MSFHLDERLPKINDKDLLKRALASMKHFVTEHEKPIFIRGHRQESLRIACELVLSRDITGLGADIGFHQEQDGTFTIVSDSYANETLPQFIRDLKRTYEEEKAIAKARALGYRVTSRGKWVQRDNEEYLQLLVAR
jgi:hypothetical protein